MPEPVRAAAFSDFDETYLAHSGTPEEIRAREVLEEYLADASQRNGLLFGWVTGSSLTSVLDKVRAHRLRTLPHFIACSLGTELYITDGEALCPDPEWLRRMPSSNRVGYLASQVVHELEARGVPLVPQGCRTSDSLVKSYYYQAQDAETDAHHLALIRRTTSRLSLGVNVSRCNPAAGDPEECYDVDLLPEGCGKRQILEYICSTYGVDSADTFAFGDSGNDLDMLTAAGRGVLVGNCTEEARDLHPHVSTRCYTDAILAELLKGLT